jgi:DME family drug/metabolite transporter
VIATGLSSAVFQMLFFVSVVAAGVSVATVISLGLAPVLLLALHSLQQRRVPSSTQNITVATALVGLGLVGMAGGAGDEAPNAALGILAAIGSGTAYALSTEWGAPLSRDYDAVTVATATMSVAGTTVLIPAALVVTYLREEPMATADKGSWALLAYLGVVTMAFAYVLLFAGLRSTSSRDAVVATLLEPVTAVLIAVLLLEEQLTKAGVVGALLIFAAIATLGRQSEEEPPAQ